MNICLVKPSILQKEMSFSRFATPPLGLAYIAAALNSHYNLQVIDASALGIDKVELFKKNTYLFGLNKEEIVNLINIDTDILCISLMFSNNWLYDKELIKHIKAEYPDLKIIAGGEHVTAVPEFCMEEAPIDFIVLGEGEDTIVELCKSIQNDKDVSLVQGIVYKVDGVVNFSNVRNRISNIQEISWPAWDLFPIDKYFENEMTFGIHRGKTLPIMATRGCPYDCTFCSSPQMWGRKYQMRDPKDFVDEIEYLHTKYNVNNFDLYDLTAIILKDWTVKMCNELIKRKLEISYQLPSGTRAEAIDFEVAQLLFKSGCKNITYAPESGSKLVLKSVRKKVKIDNMLKSIQSSNKAELNVKLNMILGFPDDTHKDIWLTFCF